MMFRIWLLAVQVIYAISSTTLSLSSGDANSNQAEALLKFKESLQNSSQLDNWDKSVEICNGSTSNWKGLVCSNGDLIMLQLEGLGLYGNIDVDSLTKLPNLRQFSVANNRFSGSVPANLNKLGGLRAVYLTNNEFSGEISENAFVGLNSIRRVVFASNRLTGRIPTSLANLPKLVDLQMQNNEFEGEMPDLPQINLTVNFANNKLKGSIPPHLRTQSSASFAGNQSVFLSFFLFSRAVLFD